MPPKCPHFDTPHSEDLKIIDNPTIPYRERMAAGFLLSQKQLAMGLVAWADGEIAKQRVRL